LVAAVHAQFWKDAVTFTDPVPTPPPNETDVGFSEKAQAPL
jgi:hypothetical protein